MLTLLDLWKNSMKNLIIPTIFILSLLIVRNVQANDVAHVALDSYNKYQSGFVRVDDESKHIALLKAVVNIKINDFEYKDDIAKLRENKRFNKDVQRMTKQLTNDKYKDSKNKQIQKILEDAGRKIYNILD